jgi:hypothetical protein
VPGRETAPGFFMRKERVVVARRRTHFLWQNEDDSDAAVQLE